MHRKIISVLTGLMLLAGTMPAAAFAEEAAAGETQPPVSETVSETEPEKETEAIATESQETAPVESSDAENSEAKKELSIRVTIEDLVSDENERVSWIYEKEIKIDQGATLEDLVKRAKEDLHIKYEFDEEGRIKSLSGPPDTALADVTLSNDTEKGTEWIVTVDREELSETVACREVILKSGSTVTFLYKRTGTESADEESAGTAEALMGLKAQRLKASDKNISFAYGNTKEYLTKAAEKNRWGYGEEWTVLGNARAGYLTEGQREQYYSNVVSFMRETGRNAISVNQSSDNSKLVLTLTSIGKDVTDVGGYDLLKPLANFNYLRAQGMNGPLWALMAFDSGSYEIPKTENGVQTTRETLVLFLLGQQHSDGGWAYSGSSDIDMTAMVIQGLTPYYNRDAKVKAAVDKALVWLSGKQDKNGAFRTGSVSSESQSQVIVALSGLGIDPSKDPRFVKKGKSAIDALLSFYVNGGGFKHVSENWKANELASVQGNYALVSYYRFRDGRNSLYDMRDRGDGYVIEIRYDKDKSKPEKDKGADEAEKKETAGAKGSTRSIGLIKLKKTNAGEVKACIESIEKVLARKLSGDAKTYTDDDIAAIRSAYKRYAELNEAGKLAISREDSWNSFEKITAAVGRVYHYDEPTGVDLRDNKEEVLPWYVKLEVREEPLEPAQSKRIRKLLGENSSIYYACDVSLRDTLEESSKWEPEKILNVSFEIPQDKREAAKTAVIHIGERNRIEFVKGEIREDKSAISIKAASFSIYGLAGTEKDVSDMLVPVADSDHDRPDSFLWIPAAVGALALILLILMILYRINRRGGQDA